ncbi:MAG: hypothetical protein RLZZ387_427 [Chloroflexota bacterium]|jgi:glycolate oxidase FAD binding subunit
MQLTDSVTPTTAHELAEALRAASADSQPVVPRGAGLHQHVGGAPPAGALSLSTLGLARVVEHTPADLTVTVEAGVTLAALNTHLGQYGQWLPWDPPAAEGATVGGLLAAGLSGPLRLGYGAPRDWVLGMRVALGDGRLVKSGGRVVKNVAGYDTHKLHIGALGTLGVIAEVTFKLAPRSGHVATLSLACPSRAQALALAEILRQPPLAPVSLAILPEPEQSHPLSRGREGAPGGERLPAHPERSVLLLARFAGVPAGVARQLREARVRAESAGVDAQELSEEEAAFAWRNVAEFSRPRPTAAHEVVLRVGASPASLAALAAELERQQPADAESLLWPGVGLAYARWPADEHEHTETAVRLAALRARLALLGGYAVVEHASGALREHLDLWGPPPPSIVIMRRLKALWDPRGIVNSGRYIGGI